MVTIGVKVTTVKSRVGVVLIESLFLPKVDSGMVFP